LSAASQSNKSKVRVLLIGDSTVLGSVPRLLLPQADHLEDVLRKLLAAQRDLPPVEVINKGEDGDTIQRLLGGRYERDLGKLLGGPLDFIFIRFGINDRFYLTDWPREFPESYRKLIAQIRRDQPRAIVTLETIIPYCDEGTTAEVNAMIRSLADEAGLPVLDTHAKFAAEMKHGPNMLVYRQSALSAIPSQYRGLIPPGNVFDGAVFIHDHSLDVHLRDIPNWFADRHPNLPGYHVIASALADYLAPLLRQRA
jgi:lysophospholipase L1-like esterase